MSEKKILVVDDEIEICELIRDYLKREGFDVILAYDGEQGLKYYRQYKPLLMILDVMLPKLDGMEVCRIVRAESSIPIIMLSAKKSDVDKILGLGLGADDYISKPFSTRELVARVKANIRRYTMLSSSQESNDHLLRYDSLEIDKKGYNVYINGEKVDLAAKEFEVLLLLALHPHQVFTREQIFERIWGYNEFGDISTITVHIRKIREKIEKNPSSPNYIKTVWGVGYKFTGGE
ncbi:response regulator transcription factor [Wukongibacter baidiensis]|uniref:winged helix-turn-helix domain-containing protein n=1 Tax=Wukongibacter baidiensis TaxID=1723361 RepID=UPI003D7FE411